MNKRIVVSITACFVLLLGVEANAVIFKGWAEGSWQTVVAGGVWSDPPGVVSSPYTSGASGIAGDYQPGDPPPDYYNDLVYHTNNNDIGGEAVFDWGLPYDPSGFDPPSATYPHPNSFTFNGSFSDGEPKEGVSIPDDNPIKFGQFDYYNGSTYFSRFITGVSLSVNFHVLDEDENGIADFNMIFDFAIVNVSNEGGPTPDIVRLLNQPSLNRTFHYDGVDYSFNVLGFLKNVGDKPTLDFSSDEGQLAKGGLYAEINPVPEPSTMLLFGAGVFGLMWGGRARIKNKG